MSLGAFRFSKLKKLLKEGKDLWMLAAGGKNAQSYVIDPIAAVAAAIERKPRKPIYHLPGPTEISPSTLAV